MKPSTMRLWCSSTMSFNDVLPSPSHRIKRVAWNAMDLEYVPRSTGDSLFSFRERIHDISCHGHKRESVLLPWSVYCLIERSGGAYLRCPNDELARALLAVVENGIEIKSVVANIRVIGIMHKFDGYTLRGVDEEISSIKSSRLFLASILT